MYRTRPFPILLFPIMLGACDDDTTTPEDAALVTVGFATSDETGNSPDVVRPTPGRLGNLVIDGSNGTLEITAIGFIVSELELDCGDDDDDRAGCAEFDVRPTFVDLPLELGTFEVARRAIPAGVYTGLEFEVENLDPDDDDSLAKRRRIEDLLDDIRTVHGYADFPDRASMVVEGTFRPDDGSADRPFRAYFEAEIVIELTLDPPLVIDGSEDASALTIDVRPDRWFRRDNGSVVDLSRFDFADTGDLIQFDFEMEDGFEDVEFDR